jgi:SAM-dependent methyltransferase
MSFDVLAPHYRWMEWILAGEKLQRCRTAFLNQLADGGRVLIAGEGNGRFLCACRRALPQARITCVDASARMLGRARARVQAAGLEAKRVEFIHADVLEWRPAAQTFDVIVTHFFLDCFRPEQLRTVVASLGAAGTPNATWLLSDFQLPAPGWRRLRALLIHRLMYRFFRIVTGLPACRLTPPDALLQAEGFALRQRQESDWGLLHTDRWARGMR